MTFREALLILHIAGAGTWLGANVVQAAVPPIAARTSAATLSSWYRITWCSPHVSMFRRDPDSRHRCASGPAERQLRLWEPLRLTIGFGMIVVGALIGQFVFGPGGDAAADAVDSGDPGGNQGSGWQDHQMGCDRHVVALVHHHCDGAFLDLTTS